MKSYSPVIASASRMPGTDRISAASLSERPGEAFIRTYAFTLPVSTESLHLVPMSLAYAEAPGSVGERVPTWTGRQIAGSASSSVTVSRLSRAGTKIAVQFHTVLGSAVRSGSHRHCAG